MAQEADLENFSGGGRGKPARGAPRWDAQWRSAAAQKGRRYIHVVHLLYLCGSRVLKSHLLDPQFIYELLHKLRPQKGGVEVEQEFS